MRQRNVPEKYVRVIQDIVQGLPNNGAQCSLSENGSFIVDVLLDERSALRLYMCLILDVPNRARKEVPEFMTFADDIVLCGGQEVDMTDYLDKWRKSLQERNMRVIRPTQFMDFTFEQSKQ